MAVDPAQEPLRSSDASSRGGRSSFLPLMQEEARGVSMRLVSATSGGASRREGETSSRCGCKRDLGRGRRAVHEWRSSEIDDVRKFQERQLCIARQQSACRLSVNALAPPGAPARAPLCDRLHVFMFHGSFSVSRRTIAMPCMTSRAFSYAGSLLRRPKRGAIKVSPAGTTMPSIPSGRFPYPRAVGVLSSQP